MTARPDVTLKGIALAKLLAAQRDPNLSVTITMAQFLALVDGQHPTCRERMTIEIAGGGAGSLDEALAEFRPEIIVREYTGPAAPIVASPGGGGAVPPSMIKPAPLAPGWHFKGSSGGSVHASSEGEGAP